MIGSIGQPDNFLPRQQNSADEAVYCNGPSFEKDTCGVLKLLQSIVF